MKIGDIVIVLEGPHNWTGKEGTVTDMYADRINPIRVDFKNTKICYFKECELLIMDINI